MSTCPRCKGHLTDGHRCPRRPTLVAIEMLLWAMGGGVAALLLVAAFDPRGQLANLDSVSFAAGAVLAVGVNRALRP